MIKGPEKPAHKKDVTGLKSWLFVLVPSRVCQGRRSKERSKWPLVIPLVRESPTLVKGQLVLLNGEVHVSLVDKLLYKSVLKSCWKLTIIDVALR